MKKLHILALLLPLLACSQAQALRADKSAQFTQSIPSGQPPIYETRRDHDPEGTGKFYQGREIAHVMGYAGASWLERPARVEEEQPDQVVEQMKLKPADVVADVGAGTGYFSFRLSRVVSQGKVFAVDIQREMLDVIEERKAKLKAGNVVAIRSTEQDVKLPDNAVDVVLLVDVYHEFAYPYEMMQSIVKALKPGGRVIQIEYRGEDPEVQIKRTHKMTVQQARKEMEFVGLRWKETKEFLPQQHFLVFEKP
ncbi:MAG: methyltransferase domain-containing protein [Acidobacteria bacterium]|nr:methyltransferase domain-containing protein [Acidobacteriota bacterium]MBI3426939.1 methyltransferase domain-containing protein [Acidobacteriota bacterium]